MSQLLFSEYRVLWMDPAADPGNFAGDGVDHCCDDMKAALQNVCDEHEENAFACPDMVVSYSPAFREYGLIIHDGGPSSITIAYCPWCGADLGGSLREEWFDRLEEMGIDDPLGDDEHRIPEPFKSARWWQEKEA